MKLIALFTVLAALVGPATAQYQFGRATYYGTDGCKSIRTRAGLRGGLGAHTRRVWGRPSAP